MTFADNRTHRKLTYRKFYFLENGNQLLSWIVWIFVSLRLTKRNSKRVTRCAMLRIPFRFQSIENQLFKIILIF
ncbi:MAG: hypothetical protein CME35_00215 [Gramella sp.]|nr:hypothetical protein [Christiangramia sp.]